jgi:hypothetical protein
MLYCIQFVIYWHGQVDEVEEREAAMNRRQAVLAAFSSLLATLGNHKESQAQVSSASLFPAGDGKRIVAISVFAGQGDTRNVDTGLTYAGAKVSPSWVGITPSGFHVCAGTGVFPHQSDTFIDVQVRGGVPWTGLAIYVL